MSEFANEIQLIYFEQSVLKGTLQKDSGLFRDSAGLYNTGFFKVGAQMNTKLADGPLFVCVDFRGHTHGFVWIVILIHSNLIQNNLNFVCSL